jgi:predicted small lipoprotein YifL
MKTKTAIIITALMILAIALLSGCGTVGPALPHQENLAFPLDMRDWQVGHSVENRSERTTEFVLKGEKIDNWTRLVTMQTVKKSDVSAESIETTVNKKAKEMSARCPETVWNVIERGPNTNTILYEFRVQNCPPDADQHEIARILDGKYNRFRIAYGAKVKTLPPEERDKWIKLLSKASIVD